MSDCLEVLFVSDSGENLHSACCFDPHVGTTLMSYKAGGNTAKKCLSLVGKSYLLAAEESKPLLRFWPLNSQEPSSELRSILPGKPTALSVSPDGCYCVAGIDGKVYVWLISAGCLLNVVSKHYQAINKILFTDDSSHFVTVGEDGLVLVWKLADVVAKQCGDIFKFTINEVAPVYTFSEHTLPVTDAFIGHGSLKARLFTVSVDQTCKIFCLTSGTMLLSLMFNDVLTAVTVNDIETELFIGTNSGKVQCLNLDPYPRSLEHHVPDDSNVLKVLEGHSGSLNCLSTSIDGITLASGAEDGKVLLWNIPARQMIRCLEMKGPVLNMFFCSASNNIFTYKFNPDVYVSKFENSYNMEDKNLELNVWVKENVTPISFNLPEEIEERNEEIPEITVENGGDSEKLKQEIFKLKEINKQLYQFAMNKLIKNPSNVLQGNITNEFELVNTSKEIE